MTRQTEFANSLVGSPAGVSYLPIVHPYPGGHSGHRQRSLRFCASTAGDTNHNSTPSTEARKKGSSTTRAKDRAWL